MNIHHLELFYHVATHGGISKAVRHMPYGIQQPAVSSQILQLEEQLGVKLFERTPFKLTASGQELYNSIQPFFGSLPELAARISNKHQPRLRIGAAEIVLADYLPPVIARLRKLHPEFRLGLQTMGTAELEGLFARQEIDLAISPIDPRSPARLQREKLISVPLVLLVPKHSPWKTSADFWAALPIDTPLIGLPATERIMEIFQNELKRRHIEWPIAIESSSLSLVNKYVANGYGIGLSVFNVDENQQRKVRAIVLDDFPRLEIFAIWPKERSPLVETLLEEIRRYVAEEWPSDSRT